MDKIYTPKQVAEILQVHPYTILKWIRAGKLKAVKVGRGYRTTESELALFLNQGTSSPPQVQTLPQVTPGNFSRTSTEVTQNTTANKVVPRAPQQQMQAQEKKVQEEFPETDECKSERSDHYILE